MIVCLITWLVPFLHCFSCLILISLAGFGLSLKTKSLSGKTMSLLALIALFLILIGILFTNPIGVTVFTAILYFIIFISYRKKNDSVSNLN